MNEAAKNYRKQAIEAEKRCREEILKEFFELKEKVLNRLEQFLETGIDDEAEIRLSGVVVEPEKKKYERVYRLPVIEFKKTLEDLKETDHSNQIFSTFASIKLETWSACIDGVIEMTELWNELILSNDFIKSI